MQKLCDPSKFGIEPGMGCIAFNRWECLAASWCKDVTNKIIRFKGNQKMISGIVLPIPSKHHWLQPTTLLIFPKEQAITGVAMLALKQRKNVVLLLPICVRMCDKQ